MTVVNPKSISGINSITTGSGSDNLLTIHTSDASSTERIRINSSGDVIVGSGITVSPDGDIFATGVTTATTFSGSGASLTNLNATNIASGTVPTARLGSGTASSSTFLRGDSTFAAVTSTTINSNTNNYLITGTGTANELQGESALTFDGSLLKLQVDSGEFRIEAANGVDAFSVDSDNGNTIIGGSGSLTIPDSIIHSGDTDTKISFPSNDTIDLQAANASRIRITSGGNVGVSMASPVTRFQVGSHTFSGGHGMYENGRVGMANHGSLTGLMLASTYNDAGVPEYGIVFVQGPDTSNYNVWSISPDGPAKGNSLSLHYGAQNTNIHILSNRKFEFDGDGDFRLTAGNVDVASGYGIDFSADGGPQGSGSELLDDYEEGTWTPDWRGASALGTTSYGTYNVASYVKIGNQVTVRGFSMITGTSGGAGTWFINNLPFTNGGGDDRRYRSVGQARLENFNVQTAEEGGDIHVFVERNNNDMTLSGNRDNQSASTAMMVSQDSSFEITFTVTYQTA